MPLCTRLAFITSAAVAPVPCYVYCGCDPPMISVVRSRHARSLLDLDKLAKVSALFAVQGRRPKASVLFGVALIWRSSCLTPFK